MVGDTETRASVWHYMGTGKAGGRILGIILESFKRSSMELADIVTKTETETKVEQSSRDTESATR